jgi:hypothetical protein
MADDVIRISDISEPEYLAQRYLEVCDEPWWKAWMKAQKEQGLPVTDIIEFKRKFLAGEL